VTGNWAGSSLASIAEASGRAPADWQAGTEEDGKDPWTPRTAEVDPCLVERPDRLELAIRFVCGAAFGWYVVGRFSVGWQRGAAALVAGLLALWFGDAFWHGLARLLP